MLVDLHIHTTASDGSMTPEEVVEKAIELGYRAIAITDHDTIEGIPSAIKAAEGSHLEVIPGIEINTDVEIGELHILGYFIDYHYPPLLEELKKLNIMRRKRAKKMLDNLKKEGIEIEWDFLLKIAGKGTIGRGHIARALFEKGYIQSWEEAFTKYIGKECPAYEPRRRLTPKKAIDVITESGGIPVLAHPGKVTAEKYIFKAIQLGIKGIEVFYLEHDKEEVARFRRLAQKYNLVMTGGSDDHGPENKDGLRLGKVKLDYSIVETLRKRVKLKNTERG
ncbi:MAG: 3,5-nucleoside bisphosphate phosphatase [Halanaerobiales bacterium]|nr:3,5-nucleoside bisphosphate phosphatase [Halanaerobiales bacterium]